MASILLFGGKGWIGGQLVSLLKKDTRICSIQCSSLRANDREAVEDELVRLQPTHVISCIGRTHGSIDGHAIHTIDYLEEPGKLLENVTDNLYAPVLLAKLCEKYGIHYTYLGTGCIFEYDTDHPMEHPEMGFKEADLPNFFGSSYSIVKGITDQLMQMHPSALNVRIRMPITSEVNDRDFITKIVRYEKICSLPNSMTVLDELLPVMVDMVLKKMSGTVQLTNPGVISHEEILTMYRELCDPTKTWKTMTYVEQGKLLKSKRSNNSLDTSRLQTLYPNVTDIKTSIRVTLEKRAISQDKRYQIQKRR